MTERPELAARFIDDAHARYNERPHARENDSAGVTSVITCARKTWLRRHGAFGDGDDSQEFKLTTVVGSAYHALLPPMNAPRERFGRIPVVNQDGSHFGSVTCYIDWLETEEGTAPGDEYIGPSLVPCELKTTRTSANKPPSEHYVEQLAAETIVADNDHGRLYILYLAGNYRPPSPLMKVYEVDFDPGELNAFQDWLSDRLRLAIGPEIPAMDDDVAFNWECKYCPARGLGLCNGLSAGQGRQGFFHENLDSIIKEISRE